MPPNERAELAGLLLKNLDEEESPASEEAWAAEIERRMAEYRAGRMKTISWQELRRSPSPLGQMTAHRERSEVAEQSFLRELDHAIEIVSEPPLRWPAYTGGTRRYVFRKFPFWTSRLEKR